MLKILLIDNYPIALRGLQHFLDSAFHKISTVTADDMFAFSDSYDGPVPDVIIFGNNEPTAEISLKVIRHCKASYSSASLIIYDHDIYKRDIGLFLHLGVKGYILKENPINEIVRCIEQVLAGQFYLAPQVMKLLLTEGIRPKPAATKQSRQLTKREKEIASFLIDGTRTLGIASRLNLKPSTISTMKKRIFFKMKVENIIQLQKAMNSISEN